MKKLGLILLLPHLLSCSNSMEIAGEWVRINDTAEGAVIKIERNTNDITGILLEPTESLRKYGFEAGDVKWKNLHLVASNKYYFKDLYKEVDLENGEVLKIRYDDFYLEINNTYDTIHTRAFAKGSEDIGTQQTWVKRKQ